MCCCDEDVIVLICVGVPMIVYALIVGFPGRDPSKVGTALKECFGNNGSKGNSNGKNPIQCLTDKNEGRLFLFIMIVAAVCIIYSIVVQILKCVLCCCCCCCGCCGCLDCFLKYAFRIGVGVGYPSLADFLTYLITSVLAKNGNGGNDKSFSNAVGGYSGLSMVSLAAGWAFTVVIGSFFIHKDSCGLKFLGLILGCIVAFVVIAAIVPAGPRGLLDNPSNKWAGVVLGLVDVVVFTAMYAAALCCLGGGCCK
ncbi:Hypothetical protein DHA2_151130 [Giardia duodenalis]|uniref:Uncharacterized protein n=1 Tax=Giardia intestinalis TaxID=5741 RepID=V6TKL4_GIAIN|nr:Hypothetical protein DHA2_151130 [Giardia intestinalis]